ncbi:hypothetical protein D3C71_2131650 [compost metagenome]
MQGSGRCDVWTLDKLQAKGLSGVLKPERAVYGGHFVSVITKGRRTQPVTQHLDRLQHPSRETDRAIDSALPLAD